MQAAPAVRSRFRPSTAAASARDLLPQHRPAIKGTPAGEAARAPRPRPRTAPAPRRPAAARRRAGRAAPGPAASGPAKPRCSAWRASAPRELVQPRPVAGIARRGSSREAPVERQPVRRRRARARGRCCRGRAARCAPAARPASVGRMPGQRRRSPAHRAAGRAPAWRSASGRSAATLRRAMADQEQDRAGGGSSSDFSSALAALRLSRSAPSITTTRHGRPSRRSCAATRWPRAPAATGISALTVPVFGVALAARSRSRSGWAPLGDLAEHRVLRRSSASARIDRARGRRAGRGRSDRRASPCRCPAGR